MGKSETILKWELEQAEKFAEQTRAELDADDFCSYGEREERSSE